MRGSTRSITWRGLLASVANEVRKVLRLLYKTPTRFIFGH